MKGRNIVATVIAASLFFSGLLIGFDPFSLLKEVQATHTYTDYPVSVNCTNVGLSPSGDGQPPCAPTYTQTLPAGGSQYQFILTDVSVTSPYGDPPFPSNGIHGGVSIYYDDPFLCCSVGGLNFLIYEDGSMVGYNNPDGSTYPPPPTTRIFSTNSGDESFEVGVLAGLTSGEWEITSFAGILRHYPLDALTANAGPDQTVDEDSTVTLDGSGSTGSITSYEWEQTSGSPSVTLNNPNTATATFQAPDVDSDSQFVFELAVADSGGQRATDSTTVTVKDTGSFSLSCASVPDLTPNADATIPCTVHSINGFNKPVSLSCNAPANSNLQCSFDSSSVTPPANGDATTMLRITANNSTPGDYTIKVSGSSTGLPTKTIDVNVKVICGGPSTLVPEKVLYQSPERLNNKGKTTIYYEKVTRPFTANSVQEAADILADRTVDPYAFTEVAPGEARYEDSNGNVIEVGTVAKAFVEIKLRVTVPEWCNVKALSTAVQQHWNDVLNAYNTHEQGHVDIALKAFKDIHTQLAGKSVTNAEATYDKIYDQEKVAQRKYDDRWKHGIRQGAVLDPSIQ